MDRTGSRMNNVRNRLKNVSVAMVECVPQCAAYAKCVVSQSSNVKKYECQKEFEELKKCFMEVMKKSKPR